MERTPIRALMIGAHPDDCEFLTGGLAAKYRALGHVVKFVSATNGNAGHHRLGGGRWPCGGRKKRSVSPR